MSQEIKIYFQFYDDAHDDRNHTVLPGLIERFSATELTPRSVEGKDFSVFALPYDEVDEAQYYRFNFANDAAMQSFLEAESAYHDAIVLTPDPETMGPHSMVLVTQDAGLQKLFAEQSIAVFMVAAGVMIDPDSFGAALAQIAAVGSDDQAQREDAMFEGAELTKEVRAVPPDILAAVRHRGVPLARQYEVLIGTPWEATSRTAHQAELEIIMFFDRLVAWHGQPSYTLEREEDGKLYGGAVYSEALSLEFYLATPADAGSDFDWDGPMVLAGQAISALPGEDELEAEGFASGLRLAAQTFGYAAAVEVPFEKESGVLRGYQRVEGEVTAVEQPIGAPRDEGDDSE